MFRLKSAYLLLHLGNKPFPPRRWWQPRFIHEEDSKYHKRTFEATGFPCSPYQNSFTFVRTLLALLLRGNRALLLTLFPLDMLNLRGNCFYLYIAQRRRIAFNLWLFFLKQPVVFQMTNSWHVYICLFIPF
jgi:hypothetical protein